MLFRSGIESVLFRELGAAQGGAYHADQRVADESCWDAGVAIEFFFKWENAQGFNEAAADYAHAPRSPGPELRADVVDIFDAERF